MSKLELGNCREENRWITVGEQQNYHSVCLCTIVLPNPHVGIILCKFCDGRNSYVISRLFSANIDCVGHTDLMLATFVMKTM